MNIEKAPIVNLDGVMNKSLRIQMQAILQQQADEHYQHYLEQYEAELKKVYLEGKAEAKQEFVKWLENHEQLG